MKTTTQTISEEIKGFYEYVSPEECTATISKMFFKYCADTAPDEYKNLLDTNQVNAIYEILTFISCHNHQNPGEIIDTIVPVKNSICYRRALNVIFFHALSTYWDSDKFLELEDIRIVKDLFELLNLIDEIRQSENTQQ